MSLKNLNDLLAFVTVARERSFTRAAVKLGVSQSALSHTIRGLEERMKMRLLVRTTRNVSTTEAGERLFQSIGPRFDEIDAELVAMDDLREKPVGTVRIACDEYVADALLLPKLTKFLKKYPDIKVEISTDYGKIDIVANGFDAGISMHEFIAKDMIAVRIAPDMRISVVGSPGYFAQHPVPKLPRELTAHSCINLRLPAHNEFCPWDFEKGGRVQRVRVDGHVIYSEMTQTLNAALAGLGIAYVPEDLAASYVAKKKLVRVLEDWCPPWPGYHLFYPMRHESSSAFSLLVNALRYSRTA